MLRRDIIVEDIYIFWDVASCDQFSQCLLSEISGFHND